MSKGRFGIHGGQYIPETLMNAVIESEEHTSELQSLAGSRMPSSA